MMLAPAPLPGESATVQSTVSIEAPLTQALGTTT